MTPATLEILTNFAQIHENATLRPGTAQRTANHTKNFIADVELDEAIPGNYAIYDLNRLLKLINTVTSKNGKELPVLEFSDQSVTIIHAHGQVTIPFAHPDLVSKVPQTKFYIIDEIASFKLPATLWSVITQQASVLECNLLQIVIDDQGTFTLRIVNDKDKGAEAFASAVFTVPELTLTKPEPNTWNVTFDSLKFIKGDYNVQVGILGRDGKDLQLFGGVFTLDDPAKKVTYLAAGNVSSAR